MAAPRPFDRDALYVQTKRNTAADVAHEALFPIQSRPPHEMVAGVAVLFSAICNRVGLDPQDVHGLGMRMLRDEDFHTKTNASLQSLRDFAGIHIAGDPDVSIS